MAIRILVPDDVTAYRELRLAALYERPPAFGSLPEDEPSLAIMTATLSATADRCFFGAVVDELVIGILRLSRYSSANEKHRAYIAGLFVSPFFRRQGHGESLVTATLDRSLADFNVRRINLTVVSQQHAAIAL